MSLPPLTDEQRAVSLEKAAKVRQRRAEVKRLLKQGDTTLPDVLRDSATDDALAKMKVLALVLAVPGVGKVRAAEIIDRLGIAENRRVRGLGDRQRQALAAEFAAA